jgi:diadenosine tetraphosphatase ApaH/serine/threonine PP2A family protein phosphatase
VKVAVISDVHSNLPALETVLEAIRGEQVEELWCLGDLVGYNAHPEECARMVLDVADICLAGNHDLVVNGAISSRVFTHDAADAAAYARRVMSEETLEQLRALQPTAERAGVSLYHASPRDPVWEYVIDNRTAAACIEQQGQPVSLVGHSHVPLMYGLDGDDDRASGGYAQEGTRPLGDGRRLINPGSVGQPRDGDPRAAYMVLDQDARTVTWRRLDYDIERTQRAVIEAGLPHSLALRLRDGR